MATSIESAYDQDQAKVSQALSRSSKDGDNSKHATTLRSLKTVHENDSIWISELGAVL
jgi:hypothetical protein